LMGGELRVLKEWVSSLPAEWCAAYPVLGLPRAGLLAFSGDLDACVRYLDEIEQRLKPAEDDSTRLQRGLLTTVRCFVACIGNDLPGAEAMARKALENLPEDELGYRPGIFVALGDTYRLNGRWEDAKACYLKVLNYPHAPAVRLMSVHVLGALADLDLRQGRLKHADAHWRKALAVSEDPANGGLQDVAATGWVHLRLGELAYEWNELADAPALPHSGRGANGTWRRRAGADRRLRADGALAPHGR
jgi:ATP/maltotriose-dependent transcriptional regulator MalT